MTSMTSATVATLSGLLLALLGAAMVKAVQPMVKRGC